MKSVKLIFCKASILMLCLSYLSLSAQQIKQVDTFKLLVFASGKDTAFNIKQLELRTSFISFSEADKYVKKLYGILASKGYPAASIDSSSFSDSSIIIYLFTGEKYKLSNIDVSSVETKALSSLIIEKNQKIKDISFFDLEKIQQKILSYYENNGYPFAITYLDSILRNGNSFSATLKVDKGVFYPIDSIRIFGNVKLKNSFIQHYLSISNSSGFNKYKLRQTDKLINELSFVGNVQPSDVTMLGSGAVLNLYLRPKKSNQINFLLGLMPNAFKQNKLTLTGDVNLDLKNMLGSGERILFKWQQLQPSSPRLNLGYTQPYIFNSAYGIDFLFEIFKKDSNFIQVNTGLGGQYNIDDKKLAKIFIQWQSSTLLSGAVDTNVIKSIKRLPDNADYKISNIGFSYQWNNTNYKPNPRNGNEFDITGLLGLKKIKKNYDIINLKDPGFNYASLYDSIQLNNYQLKLKLSYAHYFPLGKTSTLKTTVNSGLYYSPEIFRNDLFQIGGYKIMRGFDEESIYATQYGVFSAEYRMLFATNSYLSFFSDYGITGFKYNFKNVNNRFLSAGMGIVMETKAGLLNIAYAIGKRDDLSFNLKESSKIHFGYINYF